MKKIIPAIIIILLIVIVWFSWGKMSKEDVIEETSEKNLEKATQADTTDEIEVKLDGIDIDIDSSEDFDSVDAEIKSI